MSPFFFGSGQRHVPRIGRRGIGKNKRQTPAAGKTAAVRTAAGEIETTGADGRRPAVVEERRETIRARARFRVSARVVEEVGQARRKQLQQSSARSCEVTAGQVIERRAAHQIEKRVAVRPYPGAGMIQRSAEAELHIAAVDWIDQEPAIGGRRSRVIHEAASPGGRSGDGQRVRSTQRSAALGKARHVHRFAAIQIQSAGAHRQSFVRFGV